MLVAGAAWLLPLDPRLMWLLIGYSLGLFGLPWMIPWVFQGLNRMELVAGTQVARQAVFAAIVLGAVRGPAQYWLLPFAELVGIAVGAACALIVYRRVRLPAWTVEPRASLWLESLPIGGSQVIWAVRMAVPVVLVGYLHGGARGRAVRRRAADHDGLSIAFGSVFQQSFSNAVAGRRAGAS